MRNPALPDLLRAALPVAALVLVIGGALPGCVAVGAGAAGTGAAIAYDRRTTGTFIDDELIEVKALKALSEDDAVGGQTHVNVTSYNNVVLLTGEAPTEELRRQVEARVQTVEKVRRVHNEIALAAPSAMLARSSDTWITGKVKSNLLAAKTVEGSRVKVVTEAGIVYLMGLVTREEAERATEQARRVSGVQRVVRIFEYLD